MAPIPQITSPPRNPSPSSSSSSSSSRSAAPQPSPQSSNPTSSSSIPTTTVGTPSARSSANKTTRPASHGSSPKASPVSPPKGPASVTLSSHSPSTPPAAPSSSPAATTTSGVNLHPHSESPNMASRRHTRRSLAPTALLSSQSARNRQLQPPARLTCHTQTQDHSGVDTRSRAIHPPDPGSRSTRTDHRTPGHQGHLRISPQYPQ